MSAHLEELRELGVACLKIEGRLKRAEYVAAVVSVYARLLRERRAPSRDETQLLQRAFSRSGFTDDYWRANPGPWMFGTRSDTDAPAPVPVHTTPRKVAVCCDCTLQPGAAAVLTVSDADGHRVRVEGAIPEPARNRPLTPESVAERLRKTGGTAYVCEAVRVEVGEGLSLSASALNALRRDALDALSECRTTPPKRREFPVPPAPGSVAALSNPDSVSAPRYIVSVCRREQLTPELLELSPARVSMPLEWFARDAAVPDWLRRADTELCAILPRVWRDTDEDTLRDWLRRATSQGVTGAVAGNIGHLPLIDQSTARAYGDFGLNVTNARSAVWLAERGLQSVCVSFELRAGQIRDMPKPLPVEAIVYGRLPLMITENRPGGGAGDTLTDRTGAAFPLLDAYGGRTEIENSRPLWLADRDDWRKIGLSFARLRFTTETPEECARVVRGYRDGLPASGAFTRGLYERGVE